MYISFLWFVCGVICSFAGLFLNATASLFLDTENFDGVCGAARIFHADFDDVIPDNFFFVVVVLCSLCPRAPRLNKNGC